MEVITKNKALVWVNAKVFGIYFLLEVCLNILTSSVPDAGYSKNASCALNLISTFLVR